MSPVKKLPARFYRHANGNEPVRQWLKRLTPDERQVIGKDIKKLSSVGPLGCPSVALSGMDCGKSGAICRRVVRLGSSSASSKGR